MDKCVLKLINIVKLIDENIKPLLKAMSEYDIII